MVETTRTDVAVDSRERNDDGRCVLRWEKCVCEFGEGMSQSTNRFVFVVMYDIAEKTRAFADDKSGWEVGTIRAFARVGGRFTIWTNGLMVLDDVFFTTVTQDTTNLPATPTGVGQDEVKQSW